MKLFTKITKVIVGVVGVGFVATAATNLMSEPDTLSVWMGVVLLALMVNLGGFLLVRKLPKSN